MSEASYPKIEDESEAMTCPFMGCIFFGKWTYNYHPKENWWFTVWEGDDEELLHRGRELASHIIDTSAYIKTGSWTLESENI